MKVAFPVPHPVYEAAERLAKLRRVSRSQVFAEALQEYVACHSSEAVTEKLDELYSEEGSSIDKVLVQAQLASIDHEAW